MSPSATPSTAVPLLRILDSEVAEEHARSRESWSDLWRAIAREADADRLVEPDPGKLDNPDDDEAAA